MQLTDFERSLLAGAEGPAARTAMRILSALGEIYGAERTVPAASAQISGVSYDNLGEAGLEWLAEMAAGGARVRIPAMLNPAGMDLENWRALGIPPEFAEKQRRVIDAFVRMGVEPACTCTPYLAGHTPAFGEHLAWAESSAVCYANSVLGARTNREGGPGALAAAVAGVTPAYGMHLAENRRPGVTVAVEAHLAGTADFGALGKSAGDRLAALPGKPIPYFTGIPRASLEELKSLCASIATYGGSAMFHIEGITPEAGEVAPPAERIALAAADLAAARAALAGADPGEVDFYSLGCPHLSPAEIARAAEILRGRRVTGEFWITTSRTAKAVADERGDTALLEAAGVKFAVDTCCVVAPIRGRFHALATDSAKACYYASSKHGWKTLLADFDAVLELAAGGARR
jgi:predicted aconitase